MLFVYHVKSVSGFTVRNSCSLRDFVKQVNKYVHH